MNLKWLYGTVKLANKMEIQNREFMNRLINNVVFERKIKKKNVYGKTSIN